MSAAIPTWVVVGACRGFGHLAGGLFALAAPFIAWAADGPHGVPHLREQSLLVDAIVPGGTISLTRFTDPRAIDELIADLVASWGGPAAPLMHSRRGDWRTLTRLDGAIVETIELRTAPIGTEGRRIRWRRPSDGGAAERAADWLKSLLPPDTRSELPVTHRDAGRVMTTVVASTAESAGALERRLRSGLRREGFRVLSPGGAHPGRSGLALFLSRGTEEIAVTISDQDDRRNIVLHWGRQP